MSSRPIQNAAIAYWGIALSLLFNPHAPPPAAESAARPRGDSEGQGGRRGDRARARLHRCAGRILHRLRQDPHGARVQAYLKAMEALAQKYPDDDEAQIFYAITLNVAASPNDKTYANQLKGRGNPGADLQTPAAASRRCSLSDPSLRHAGARRKGPRRGQAIRRDRAGGPARSAHAVAYLHARRRLEESIASNTASARAAKDGKDFDEQLHAMDYMVYAYLQLGAGPRGARRRR